LRIVRKEPKKVSIDILLKTTSSNIISAFPLKVRGIFFEITSELSCQKYKNQCFLIKWYRSVIRQNQRKFAGSVGRRMMVLC
jgi:hypothetical protein